MSLSVTVSPPGLTPLCCGPDVRLFSEGLYWESQYGLERVLNMSPKSRCEILAGLSSRVTMAWTFLISGARTVVFNPSCTLESLGELLKNISAWVTPLETLIYPAWYRAFAWVSLGNSFGQPR